MNDTTAREALPPTFAEARRALRADETSCEALVTAFLERIDAENERLNALLSVDADGALGHARYLDRRRKQGRAGPLTGLVLAIKDVVAVRGDALTCGSKMLEDHTALYDAAVIERLRDAGALFIGRANCDEFAMGSSNETSHFGPARHPESDEHVPGLVGLRPTYGRVPRHGLVAHASSLDCLGPLARSVEDAARLLDLMAGPDARDATSADAEAPDYTAVLGGDPRAALDGVRVGVPREYIDEAPFADALAGGVRQRVEAQTDALQAAGADVVDVSMPHAPYGLAAYYVLATAEASSNLARYDGVRYGHRFAASSENGSANGPPEAETDGESALERMLARSRSEGFGEETQRRIMLGTYVLSEGARRRYYEQARRVRTLIKDDFDRAFDGGGPGNGSGSVDVLLTPAAPTPAFRRGSRTDDPMSMYRSDLFTVGPSLAGLPALALPAGRHPDEPHLPVGVQLVGRAFDEAFLLRVGEAMERFQLEN
ncbi:MAG: Asp-tRNA(Asn)/Glu-tRNA(Gln) amidotransferase GatCAB subunit A [Bacteroidetes bacterium SW_4_67_19]|nr:MAG: Asp-tRNA(Asn)/Glu-tRNA(Gln) amidotransferase GatCAB subunit A [Bacteroidetes bacterium SW_4_67_19]